jgi:acyl carrier protein
MRPGSLEDEVKRLVAEKMAVRAEQLTPATRLLQDIGVDGADGWELMAAVGARFGIDMSGFQADLHFGPEGDAVTGWAARLFGGERRRFVPITVGDLVTAARSGQWRTPDRDPV